MWHWTQRHLQIGPLLLYAYLGENISPTYVHMYSTHAGRGKDYTLVQGQEISHRDRKTNTELYLIGHLQGLALLSSGLGVRLSLLLQVSLGGLQCHQRGARGLAKGENSIMLQLFFSAFLFEYAVSR